MTQEEKQLLLRDLCGRLPYGIKVWYPNGSGAISTVKGIVGDICYFNENPIYDNFCHIEILKPYLRPMSSMTEDERNFLKEQEWAIAVSVSGTVETTTEGFDWLNEHHFDYRGLIPMGLALEALEGMYKTK